MVQNETTDLETARSRPDGGVFLTLATIAASLAALCVALWLVLMGNGEETPLGLIVFGAAMLSIAATFWIAGTIVRALWFLPGADRG